MGLDTVELILRTEETFDVLLSDEVCSHVSTVGDLYRLVLAELELPYRPVDDLHSGSGGRDRSKVLFQPFPCTLSRMFGRHWNP